MTIGCVVPPNAGASEARGELMFFLDDAVRVRSAGDARAVARGVREPCRARGPLSMRTLWR